MAPNRLMALIAGTSGAKLYSMGLNIIALALTARWLGPDGRGALATLTTWVNTVALLASLSLGTVAMQRLAGCRHSERFGAVLHALFLWALGLTLFAWFVVALLRWGGGSALFGEVPDWALALVFVMLPCLLWEGYANALLTTIERLRVFNLSLITGRTLMLLGLLGLAWFDQVTLASVLLVSIVGQCWIAFYSAPTLKAFAAEHGGVRFMPSESTALLHGGVRLHLNTVGTLALNMAGTLMIASMVGVREAGFFQLAQQLMSVLLVIPQSASLVLYGRQGELGPDQVWPLQRKMVFLIVLLTAGIGAVLALTAPYWLVLVAGAGYEPAVPLLLSLLPALVVLSFSSIMASQWIGRGFFLSASMITLVVGAGNLLAASILIPRFGVMGAIYGQMLALSVSILTNGAMAVWCERRFRQQAIRPLG
ncbi:MAG: hypothetical protein RI925_1055 [Pseudomonadota bacterium]|jgi:O-antigen/teichoic acid export membrane protein